LMNAEPGGKCPQIRWTLGELCEQVQLHSGKKDLRLPERIGDIQDMPRICSLGLLHVQCFPDMQHHVRIGRGTARKDYCGSMLCSWAIAAHFRRCPSRIVVNWVGVVPRGVSPTFVSRCWTSGSFKTVVTSEAMRSRNSAGMFFRPK